MSKNMLQEGADRFWWTRGQYLAANLAPFSTEQPISAQELSNRAFRAGARWSMTETTKMNPYVTRFIEMITLLGFDNEDAEEHEKSRLGDSESAGNTNGQGDDDGSDVPAVPDDVLLSTAESWDAEGFLR